MSELWRTGMALSFFGAAPTLPLNVMKVASVSHARGTPLFQLTWFQDRRGSHSPRIYADTK